MVLQFVVDGHTTCFGLYGHLQVCKIFSFLFSKESASLRSSTHELLLTLYFTVSDDYFILKYAALGLYVRKSTQDIEVLLH
jgi:hypothetical protein